jgi:hypothetical protein
MTIIGIEQAIALLIPASTSVASDSSSRIARSSSGLCSRRRPAVNAISAGHRRICTVGSVCRSEVGFLAEDELPAALSTRRVLLPHLKRLFEHVRQPELPTDFD